MSDSKQSRRSVLKSSTVVGAAALAAHMIPAVHAAGDETVKIALVGCGGRGGGAVREAMNTSGPTKLVAIADVFGDKTKATRDRILKEQQYAQKLDLPEDRAFVGFQAYKQAVDAVGPGGVVILATPPAFRPIHLEYAVEKGCHVFMEKSFAVDAPGIRRVMKAGELARQKNLKIAGGLMSRHSVALQQCIEQIHKGAIGAVIMAMAYRMHGPVGFSPRQPNQSEVEHQIRNYSSFTWVNGSFLLDWLIHNIDVCCWVKDGWPVQAQAQGGRQMRTAKDQLFDHYACEFTFADGTRLMAQGRHMDNVWGFFGCHILGATGCGVLGEGVSKPMLYKGHQMTKENVLWQPQASTNPYQFEHDRLFEAIRKDLPYNETDRCAKSAMTAIMGRMAVESGAMVTWDKAIKSDLELAPGLENLTLAGPAPVQADANGDYAIAKPGKTKAY